MSKSSWLDRLGKAAEQRAEPTAEPRLQRASPKAPAKSAPKPKQKPVVQMTWFQTRPASEGGDLGAVEPVYYSIVDGVLRVHRDPAGEGTAHAHELQPGEDPKQVAARIGKQDWLLQSDEVSSDFNRPLYPRRPRWMV
jgi:hypothetical protein